MSKLTVTAASLLLLLSAQSILAKPVRVGPSRQTMKVISMVESGPIVTLRFDNGSTADVAKSTLRIRDEAHKRGTARSIAELSRTSNLPAIATVAYMPDGTVRKVRLRVFANETAMNAFATKRAGKEQNR